MVNVAEHSLREVDVILWLVEPTDYIGAGEQHIIEELKKVKAPVILVINKIDTVKKEQLLEYIDIYRKRQIVAELIREKVLRSIDEEIPHGVAVTIESMKYGKKIVDINATIICERDSHKGIIIGKSGQMLKKIGSMARSEIEDLLEQHVNLQLWVKVKKDWRDSDFLIKNFGYNPRENE